VKYLEFDSLSGVLSLCLLAEFLKLCDGFL